MFIWVSQTAVVSAPSSKSGEITTICGLRSNLFEFNRILHQRFSQKHETLERTKIFNKLMKSRWSLRNELQEGCPSSERDTRQMSLFLQTPKLFHSGSNYPEQCPQDLTYPTIYTWDQSAEAQKRCHTNYQLLFRSQGENPRRFNRKNWSRPQISWFCAVGKNGSPISSSTKGSKNSPKA